MKRGRTPNGDGDYTGDIGRNGSGGSSFARCCKRSTSGSIGKWDLVFWITAIFVVAGAADITKQLFAGDWDFWTDWKDPQWWPVITAFATIIIPSALQYIQWVGLALSHRRDLHLGLLLHGGVGRPLFSVARRRELSAELRVADLHRVRGDHPRLAADEDQELHPHLAVRRSYMGLAGLGLSTTYRWRHSCSPRIS